MRDEARRRLAETKAQEATEQAAAAAAAAAAAMGNGGGAGGASAAAAAAGDDWGSSEVWLSDDALAAWGCSRGNTILLQELQQLYNKAELCKYGTGTLLMVTQVGVRLAELEASGTLSAQFCPVCREDVRLQQQQQQQQAAAAAAAASAICCWHG